MYDSTVFVGTTKKERNVRFKNENSPYLVLLEI